MESATISRKLKELMLKNGIANFGVIEYESVADRLLRCSAVQRIPKNSLTVIVAVFPYLVDNSDSNLSRYARVPDYHAVLLSFLSKAANAIEKEFNCACSCFTDISPIPEVYAAAIAGLGRIGDHHLLITPAYGSFVFIGEIVTDFPFETQTRPVSYCRHCQSCQKACPTQILPESKRGRCLSAITQKKGALLAEEVRHIQKTRSVWGCDICQTACPYNLHAHSTSISEFTNGYRPCYHPSENRDGRAYAWRPREVIDRNYRILTGNQE